MKRIYSVFCIIFFCFLIKGNAQVISAEEKIDIQEVMDSSDYNLLRNPARSLHFALQILTKVPYKGNEIIHIEALLNAANGEKMLFHTEEALRYAAQALKASTLIDDRERI